MTKPASVSFQGFWISVHRKKSFPLPFVFTGFSYHRTGDGQPYLHPYEPGALLGLARIQYFSFGGCVVVPVNIAEPLGTKVGRHQVPVSASSITWLPG